MSNHDTQHTAFDVQLALSWVTSLVRSTDAETAPIRAAVIEAARIIACAKADIAISEKTDGRLLLANSRNGTDDNHCSFSMDDAIHRARAAILVGATDGNDSIFDLINYDVGPGDKAGRKQALVNILSLFQNSWVHEELYLSPESWDLASTINFHFDRLVGLMDDAVFCDTDDITILAATEDAAQASFMAGDLGQRDTTLATIEACH